MSNKSSSSSSPRRDDRRKRSRYQQQQQQQQSAWKDQPQFLDAAASVSVSTFGARRLPEIRRLYAAAVTKTTKLNKASKPDQALNSGGCKTSSRHLRRRTTAIKTRNKFHRFPNGNGVPTKTDGVTDDHQTTKSGENDDDDNDNTKCMVRKAKRGKRSLLCQSHHHWQQQQQETQKNGREMSTSSGSSSTTITTTTTTANWTMTHLWHTKRFHMDTLWGWRIPLCHTNRGARAMFRLEQENRCAIQDITWKRQPITFSLSYSCSENDNDTSAESLGLLVQLCRRFCPDFGSSKATLCGSQMGNGILHELDQFPCRAIGPASWMISHKKEEKKDTKPPPPPPTTTTDGDNESKWIVQWMVHPSLRSSVMECLEKIIVTLSSSTEDSLKNARFEQETTPRVPKCCLRISGSSATRILRNTLSSLGVQEVHDATTTKKRQQREWDWNMLQHHYHYPAADWKDGNNYLPHGAIVRVVLLSDASSCSGTKSTTAHSMDAPVGADSIAKHVAGVQKAIESWDPSETGKQGGAITDSWLDGSEEELLLVWRCPRPLDCAVNRAISGWDLYVPPNKAMDIWMALEMEGSSCAIGIVEESHLHLECSPPLPVFPRDYVDTEQAALYWNGSDTAWRTVRRLYEGGWGRLPVKQDTKLQSIDWGNILVNEDEDTGDDNGDDKNGDNSTPRLVVVRGAFGQPFVDAVTGCGHLPETSDAIAKRRKRRRVRPPNETCFAPPLPRDAAEQLSSLCKNLQASLSLPAALACHVRSFGQGRICIGMQLAHLGQYLGRVTAGEFSLSRGVCHGVAIIGAARLLLALEEAANGKSGCIVRQLNGNREVHLAVRAKASDGEEFQASVSLILK